MSGAPALIKPFIQQLIGFFYGLHVEGVHRILCLATTSRVDTSKTDKLMLFLSKWASKVPPFVAFCLIGGLNALVLVVLTPPFQVHDEFQHFFRSYQLSEGHVWATVSGNVAGGYLPSSLPAFVERTWGTLGIWIKPPLGTHSLADTWTEFERPLAPDHREFADFTGAAAYSPLPYIPQAIAIALGRLLNMSPLGLMYIGRLANALVAVGILTWSLRLLPLGAEAALALALLPMAQYEYASLAPDAGIISTAFLFTAVVLRAGLRGSWAASEIVMATISGTVFCSIKIVYAPLLLIGIPAIYQLVRRGGDRRNAVQFSKAQFVILIFALGISVLWVASNSAILKSSTLIGGEQQAISFATHPMDTMILLLRDLRYHGSFYIRDAIGIFGVFNVPMPVVAYGLGVASLACSLFASQRGYRLDPVWVLWNLFIMAGTVAGIQIVIAALSNPPGTWLIHGVQGRYFLPLGAAASATFASLVSGRTQQALAPFAYAGVLILVLLMTAIMDRTITHGFQVL